MSNKLKPAPEVSAAALGQLERQLDETTLEAVRKSISRWVQVKKSGGKVVVVTGSGPNLHEGVTTQLAKLVEMELVDGIITSSAVVCHELSGALERVRRVDGAALGLSKEFLASDQRWEVAVISREKWRKLSSQTLLDEALYEKLLSLPGPEIIKVAGNMAYPTGLWIERMAREFLPLAQGLGLPLEAVMGPGCDPRTMLGACARHGVPCLVSLTQITGGGQVGLSVGDSISNTRRANLLAELLGSADLIIESGVALTQDIHDGPLEMYSGHGIWSHYDGHKVYSLKDKLLVRIDLDPQLKLAWEMERKDHTVAEAIDKGLPKAATMRIPFRMEMSGFARLPGSLPIVGDIGIIWPLLATGVAQGLGNNLDFVCYKQRTPEGEAIRNYIVNEVEAFDKEMALTFARERKAWC